MAGNNQIVLNAQFNPFSYQELLAPVQQASTELNAEQDDEGKLQALSSVWQNRLSADNDPIAYKRYTDFTNQIQQQSSDLAANGLTPGSRGDINALHAAYSSDISPIEEAYLARQKGAAAQAAMQAADPTNSLQFEHNLGNASVDDFLKNPNYSSASVSGNAVATMVKNAAEHYATQLQNAPAGSMQNLGHGYLGFVQKYGANPQDIDAVINDPNSTATMKGAALAIRNIRDSAIKSTGVLNWQNGQQVYQNLIPFANQGVYSALGKTEVNPEEDWMMKFRMEEDAKAKAAKAAQTPPPASPMSFPGEGNYYTLNPKAAKDFKSLKGKLFDANGVPEAMYFGGTDGKSNPVSIHEANMDYNKNIDAQVANLRTNVGNITGKDKNKKVVPYTYAQILQNPNLANQDYNQQGINGNQQKINALLNQKKYDNLSDNDYKLLKNYGIKANDTWRDTKNKMGYAEQQAQLSFSTYSTLLKDNTPVDDMVKRALATDPNALQPLNGADDNFSINKDKNVDSNDYMTDRKSATKSEPTALDYKYSYYHNGMVITTQTHKEYKLKTTGDKAVDAKIAGMNAQVHTDVANGWNKTAKEDALALRNYALEHISQGSNFIQGATGKSVGNGLQ